MRGNYLQPPPSASDTKKAHSKFISTFANSSIDELLKSFSKIQKYNDSKEPKYTFEDVFNDTISHSLINVKNDISALERAIEDINSTDLLKIISESIENKLFIITHKLSELEQVTKETFNVIIFTAQGKSGVSYLTDYYIPFVKENVKSLENAIKTLKSDLEKGASHSSLAIEEFQKTDFSVDTKNIEIFIEEYRSFYVESMKINQTFNDLNKFGNSLKFQANGIGYENVITVDGFCDLDEYLLETMLSDLSKSKFTEWGGQYDSKKDWMHFGITRKRFNTYLE